MLYHAVPCTASQVSKSYRVYFSKTGEDVGQGDYLVDHSIIHYLIGPDGEFITFYGKNFTAQQVTTALLEQMRDWQQAHPDWHPDKRVVVVAAPAAAKGAAAAGAGGSAAATVVPIK